MSTRCTITVRDRKGDNESFSVYRHQDGYPEYVVPDLKQALSYAWPLPRFEADDFAAAIIAAFKKPGRYAYPGVGYPEQQGGNIRMSGGRDSHGDTAFHYEIYSEKLSSPWYPGTNRVCVDVYKPTKWDHSDDRGWKRTGKRVYLNASDQAPLITMIPERWDLIEADRVADQHGGWKEIEPGLETP